MLLYLLELYISGLCFSSTKKMEVSLDIISLFFYLAVSRLFGDLSSQLGIEPKPLVVKLQSPNHWTARELPGYDF